MVATIRFPNNNALYISFGYVETQTRSALESRAKNAYKQEPNRNLILNCSALNVIMVQKKKEVNDEELFINNYQ
jgi:hypothetical protein